MSNLKLYRHALSGHSHRVELFLSILGMSVELIDVDLAQSEHKSQDFLTLNAFGQVPVLIDGNHVLSDSNAILVYLARNYDTSNCWLPEDPALLSEVQRFLSISAGQIASGPAAARLHNVFGAEIDHAAAVNKSEALLSTLDHLLSSRNWLAGDKPTIADLANYAYIAHAPEGDVDLSTFSQIARWLNQIENLPGFVPMQKTSVGLAA